MVQWFTPAFGSGNRYFQIFFDFVLAEKFPESARSQACIKWLVLSTGFTRYDSSYFYPVLSLFLVCKRGIL